MGMFEEIFSTIGDWTWGWSLIPFPVVLGVFISLASGLVQFRFFGRMFKVLFQGKSEVGKDRISPREALPAPVLR